MSKCPKCGLPESDSDLRGVCCWARDGEGCMTRQLDQRTVERDDWRAEAHRVVACNRDFADKLAQRTQERDDAIAECHEQARLLGISGSTEAALLAKLERIRAAFGGLVIRCDGQDGVKADDSNIDTSYEHAILDAEFGEGGW